MWGRFRRWPRATPMLGVAALLIITCTIYVRSAHHRGVRLGAYSEPDAVLHAGSCEVLAAVGADTVLLRQSSRAKNGKEFVGQVRLLGIGTPPGFCDDAIAFLEQAVSSGSVRLELDKRRLDREGRFLAYVYAGDKHLSEELVTAGLARVNTYPGDSMTINRHLLRAQDQARIKQIGLWSPDVEPQQRVIRLDD